MLLKFKYFVKFLQQHGAEVYPEVRKEYVETLSRIYRSAICAQPRPPGSSCACDGLVLTATTLVHARMRARGYSSDVGSPDRAFECSVHCLLNVPWIT